MTLKCLFFTLLIFGPYHEENWTFHYKKMAVVLETAVMVNFEDQIYRDIFVKLIPTRELFKPRHRSHPM